MMTTVQSRIKPKGLTRAIHLSKEEMEVYRGAGWHLASFSEGVLKELIHLDNLSSLPAALDWVQKHGDHSKNHAPLIAALDWVKRRDDVGQEVWVVMCSSGLLCELTPITGNTDNRVSGFGKMIHELVAMKDNNKNSAS